MNNSDLTLAFSSLASERRLQLLQLMREKARQCSDLENCDLSDRCCNVSELAEAVGIAISTVSYHLRELRLAGLIKTEREGKQIYCSINPATSEQLAQFFLSFAQDMQVYTGEN